MFDKEKLTTEFYDKLSDSEKKELVQVMLEDRLTDPLHIKGLPKPVQNCIKNAVKSSAKDMKDEDEYLMTGATKNFKPSQAYDRLQKIIDECVSNKQYTEDSILDAINEDYFKSEDNYLMKPYTVDPNTIYIKPRGYGMKFWIGAKLSGLKPQSFSIDEFPMYKEPVTTVQLKSVIHMAWPKPKLSDLKVHDFRYGKMWNDSDLINYAAADVSHIINTIDFDSFSILDSDIYSGYRPLTPNLNDINKKKLFRVIKRRKKK